MPDHYVEFDFIVTNQPVAAVTCLRCGAALILRSSLDAVALHDSWHARTPTLPPNGLGYAPPPERAPTMPPESFMEAIDELRRQADEERERQ